MNVVRVAGAVAAAVCLASCANQSKSPVEPSRPAESSHTLRELCDAPKQFFASEFHAADLKIGTVTGVPLSERLGDLNQCTYHTADDKYLGYLYLDAPTAADVHSQPAPTRLTIDGVPVTETPEPLPSYMESRYTPLRLTAVIEGWKGQFYFLGGEDSTVQAAARLLVDAVRMVKG
ncbi:hypothetical protein DFR70_102215 [Nocardia tenerifensis]|uniref:DUF3558 domain-containing protein n=1 Tax=Nocardia tenerifensis TaxID=228006 RepID=A0A318K6L6_9NOCA|nr:hypothetical protein [Nocardia tenerifensis]PXX68533.1 hypothetical protein DFR70_102215 [Nocardia tenerifensis]